MELKTRDDREEMDEYNRKKYGCCNQIPEDNKKMKVQNFWIMMDHRGLFLMVIKKQGLSF